MASTTSPRPLAVASQRVIDALLSLDAAVEMSLANRSMSASQRETLQAEITASWQVHTNGLEADIQTLMQENGELKQRSAALSSELQALQQQYVTLQQTAGKVSKRLDQSIEQLDMLLESA
jgi:chromosome segregation ATPase